MSARTHVSIDFEPIKLNPQFFQILDKSFEKQGLYPAEKAILIPRNRSDRHEALWKDIGVDFVRGKSIRIVYEAAELHLITVMFHYESDSVCNHIGFEASAWAFGDAYNLKEKEAALKVEAVALELHKALNALNTVATSGNDPDKGPWFRFSAEEWKPLGEIPMEK